MIKKSRLIAVILLLFLSLACFISAPVLAEGPWDGDERVTPDGRSSGGGITDIVDDGDQSNSEGVLRASGQVDDSDLKPDLKWVIFKSIIKIIFINFTHGNAVCVSPN
ncbi:MAG: hypothetical protein ABIJ12_03775 [bacterium]